ncbi:MAG: prepilin-type N-terminal cleavage/methylation domain-containing protein [Planctomycetota bacterium]|nr:prepilin-type N-terminal cleavage/methylation domain-containing protein [Planctomycetota bacterium]
MATASQRRRTLPGHRAGFTVIEMMVVVAIIAILVGLLVPVVGGVREKAKIKATQTLIEGISTALNRYLTDFDDYPKSNVEGNDLGLEAEPDSLYRYLCGEDGKGIAKKTGSIVRQIEPYFTPPSENVRREGKNVYIVDPWLQRISYLNCKQYTDQRRVDPNYIDDGKCHNPTSFDIWSTGPDRKKDDPAKPPGDDINNWR